MIEAAVVSASHGAMGSLLGKLGELLTSEYKLLIKEAKGQILFLKAELESMYAFLKKISDKDQPDEQDKCWAKEVRELSYDIEDSVSEFMLRVERESGKPRGFKGFIKRSTKLLTTMNIKHEMAKKFEGLKIRVKEASERHTRYNMGEAAPKPIDTSIDPRLLALHADTASLVGVQGPRDKLIQLMDEEGVPAHQLKVLSIVGFGGLGKTTLANEIYRRLEDKFQCRAFVSVSQKPNIMKILRKILSQAGFVAPIGTNKEIWEESDLINELQKLLLDKRYLIVIDDIWDASAWDIIRCALPENKNGSRVITTTRIEAVARACCSGDNECVYKMEKSREENFITVTDDIQDMTGHQDKIRRLSLNLEVPASFCYLQSFHALFEPLFSRVPRWICQLHSLYDLVLAVEEVLEDDVGKLAELPFLIHLNLHIYGAPKEKILIRGGSGFPALKHFIVTCSRISCMTFEAGAMSKLQTLKLQFNARGWDRYGAAPTGIEHLSGLEEIYVRIGGIKAKESNKRAAESALRDAANMHPGRPIAYISCGTSNRGYAFDDTDDESDETEEDGPPPPSNDQGQVKPSLIVETLSLSSGSTAVAAVVVFLSLDAHALMSPNEHFAPKL
nr:unnamed protein product [Digitaria exilis]